MTNLNDCTDALLVLEKDLLTQFALKSLGKHEIEDGFKLLVRAYSVLYSWKIWTGRILRTYEEDPAREEKFLTETRGFVLKGLGAEERDKMRHFGIPEKIKEVYNAYHQIGDLLDMCRRVESVLYSASQLLQLDLKMSGFGHSEN